jgi:pimeloyl-ACP methyl ester carboxylesterase
MEEFTERALTLGRRNSMVGIITDPTIRTPCKPSAVVILNTGIIHRVGHNRMYVALSRTLAAAGHTVLRFDFSGLGDSAPRDDGRPLLESSLADIGEALDWLQTVRGTQRVVLLGLCSGADHALLYGHMDPRVVGLVLMDPSIPPTARHLIHYIRPRLTRLSSWLSVPRGKSRVWQMLVEQAHYAVSPTWEPQYVSLQSPTARAHLEMVYQKSVDCGIEFLAIFTGGTSSRQTYRDQLLDAFPGVDFGTRLRLEFFANCDHTFSREADRRALIQAVTEWTQKTPFRGVDEENTIDSRE